MEYFFNEEDIEERGIKIYSDKRITIQFPNKSLFGWMVDIFTITEETDTEKILAGIDNSLLNKIIENKNDEATFDKVVYTSLRSIFKELGVDWYSTQRNEYLINIKLKEITTEAKRILKGEKS